MNQTQEPQDIDNYLREVQSLKMISTKDPEKLDTLLNFVEERKRSVEGSTEKDHLFRGEQAFHKGDYEQALVNYMQAREVPNFEFFCYRATAYVSYVRGDIEKAKSFAIKALDFQPNDFDCLKLYHEILTLQGNPEKAKEIQEKLDTLQNQETPIMETTEPVKLEEKTPTPLSDETTNQFIATKLGVDLDSEKELETRIQEFQQKQTTLIQSYLDESNRQKNTKDHSLYILNGWSSYRSRTEQPSDVLLMEQSRQSSGGFFIRWNGLGIVINPGSNFLENFHQKGLYIGDINFVIVTQDFPEAHADVKKIYDLNYQLNKVSPELHVITYYLNHKAYQDLSHTLKPNFKQERNTVHSLELFLDSPDVESEEIAEGITLNYFAPSSRGGYIASDLKDSTRSMQASSIGIRLDLMKSGTTVKLGYVSGTSWSPLLAHHLGHCDILITAFGTTNPNDYGKLNYNENTLGYFGTYTLLEEVKPKLLLCAEFNGREGDIRLEVAKKLRKEYEKTTPSTSSILPADNGLSISLTTQQVECSISQNLIEPNEIKVVKSSGTHGKLQYLSPTCIL